MGRPAHPITKRISEAVKACEQYGVDVTVPNVVQNAKNLITWADTSPDETLDEALRARVVRHLRDGGYIIADRDTGRRSQFWQGPLAEQEEQLAVMERSNDYDRNRIAARRMVVDLLRTKAAELGYEPCPELFRDDVERIYAMHGIDVPSDVAA